MRGLPERLGRHGVLPEREIMAGIGAVAVGCSRVRDRVAKGAGRIRLSSRANARWTKEFGGADFSPLP